MRRNPFNPLCTLAGAACFALAGHTAGAHELWIEPRSFVVEPGAEIEADIRVGQNLKGPAYSYNPASVERFEVRQGAARDTVTGNPGDRPTLGQAARGEGLAVLVYQSRNLSVTYNREGEFEEFVEHMGADWVVEAHAERGLPTIGFKEAYSRYAKALVAVGDGEGADSETGLETEIVALENPFTDDMSDGLDVRVLYRGAPRADALVELFARGADGNVEVTPHRADSGGRVTLPVVPGRLHLANSVVLREPDGDAAEAVPGAAWESLWASLVFMIPE